MAVQTKLNIKINSEKKKPNFMCLILNTKGTKNSFNGKILGLTLAEWIGFSCEDMPYEVLDYDKSESILEFAKKHIDVAFDYTIILLSCTPLITNSTLKEIMEYAEFKNVNLCKLHMGYVVKNEYLQKSETLNLDSVYSQNLEDFYVVENKLQYTFAFKVLQERINSFHIANGVDIVNPVTTYIEPFVDIKSGVKIFPNNTLKGKTTIASDVILKENNVIENSKIGKSSCVSNSEINNSIIAENVFVASFSSITDSIIGHDVIIENYCKINKFNINANEYIKANSILGDTNDSNSRAGKSGQKL